MFQNGVFEEGPKLPKKMRSHCAVQVNTTHIFVAGGYFNEYFNDAWLLDWTTKEWIDFGGLPFSRFGHSCGVAPDPPRVVVTGTAGQYKDPQTEILYLDSMKWFVGPQLPGVTDIKYTQSVQHYYSFLQVGGESDGVQQTRNIFEYDYVNNDWIVRDEKLPIGVFEHVAFKIPDSVLGC